MDDKTWELLKDRLTAIEADLKLIHNENKEQTRMLNTLKVTVAGISSTVTIIITWAKAKFFGS